MPLEPLADDDDENPAPEPLSDLLFGLVALLVPVIAVLLPVMKVAADAVPARDHAAASSFLRGDLTVAGHPAAAFFAGGAGLRIRDDGDRVVAVDRMLDDQALVTRLDRAKDTQQPILLLIEPDGQEAAFLFEAIAASRGVGRLLQVRIDPACAFVRNSELASQCVGSVVGGARS